MYSTISNGCLLKCEIAKTLSKELPMGAFAQLRKGSSALGKNLLDCSEDGLSA